MMPGRRRTVVAAATVADNATVAGIDIAGVVAADAPAALAGGLVLTVNFAVSGADCPAEAAVAVNDVSAFASSECPRGVGAAVSSAQLDALPSPAGAPTAGSVASVAAPVLSVTGIESTFSSASGASIWGERPMAGNAGCSGSTAASVGGGEDDWSAVICESSVAEIGDGRVNSMSPSVGVFGSEFTASVVGCGNWFAGDDGALVVQ